MIVIFGSQGPKSRSRRQLAEDEVRVTNRSREYMPQRLYLVTLGPLVFFPQGR